MARRQNRTRRRQRKTRRATRTAAKPRKSQSPPDDDPNEPGPDMNETIPRKIHQVYGMFDDGVPIKDIPIFDENVKKTTRFCKNKSRRKSRRKSRKNFEKKFIAYKMWGLSEANKLIETLEKAEPEQKDGKEIPFRRIWTSTIFKKQPILKADFIRYCILYEYGGIYVDCDIHPQRPLDKLFKMPYFFVTWANDTKRLPYNAVLGTYKHNPLYRDILSECCRSFYEKVGDKGKDFRDKSRIYKTWKGRFVFQTTGHFMLQRVLKSQKVNKKDYVLNDVLVVKGEGKKIVGNPDTALFVDSNASVWFEGK